MPSLLAGDFGNLAASARKAEEAGGDALHLDIMDGVFVPNVSMGPDVVRMARRTVKMPLNVHLMMVHPDWHARSFAEAGAGTILIQVEAQCDIGATLDLIGSLGVKPGIVLNPETPAETADPWLGQVAEVLCMSVHPGFGGQRFMPEVLPKIAALRRRINELSADGRKINLSIDGGINLDTVAFAAGAGANAIVAGSALYKAKDMCADVKAMREKAQAALAVNSTAEALRPQGKQK